MPLTDNYFDTYAWDPRRRDRSYAANWRSYGFHVFERYLSDLEACALPYPKRVIDFGAADGHVIADLLRRGIDARGVELSKYMYEAAAPDIRARIQHGDVRELAKKIRSKCTDCIYETAGQYLPEADLPEYFRELARITSQDLVLLVHTKDMSEKSHHEQVTHKPDQFWRDLITSSGFIEAGDSSEHPFWFQKAE